jgi:hypothetical protein
MNRYTFIKIALIAITLGSLALFTLTSCGGSKYGCGHGAPRQSWNRMVNRINSFN